jgi:hypothetical protein
MANLWDQMEGESPEAYAAFRQGYLELGAERTLAEAATTTGREPRLIQRLASLFQWIKRARAYDRWLNHVQEVAVKKSLEKDAVTWARRRSQFREVEYSLAGELIQQARKILALPITEEVIESDTVEPGEDGMVRRTVIVIKPVRVTMRDAAIMIDTASKLARLSANLETERKLLGLDVSGDLFQRLGIARQLYDRLRAQYANRPDVLEAMGPLLAEQWDVELTQLTDGDAPPSDENGHQLASESEN